jgi:hypothetical protein
VPGLCDSAARPPRGASMNDPAGLPALLDAIRHLHGVEARHVATEHVHEKTPDGRETVWEGDVEVFELVGHPKAERCYAWSEETAAGKRRFFAALAVGAVDSAARAVQGSVLVDVQMSRNAARN